MPGNRIGPLFCLIGALLGVGDLLFQWADQALFISDDLPGGATAAWLQNFGLPLCFGLLGVAVLLFPDGRLPSPRWRWVLWLAFAGIALNALGYGLRPGPLDDPFSTVDNPLGIPGAFDLMDAFSGLGWMFMGASVGLAAVGSGLRLRRARGVERAQLKWLALAAAFTGIAIIADVVSYFAAATGFNEVRAVVLGLGFTVFPLTAGAAILRLPALRHRRRHQPRAGLRRADRHARRRISRARAARGPRRRAARTSRSRSRRWRSRRCSGPPARASRRAVDRRFYRRRYDAAQTLEAFGVRLRDELDLEALGADLRGVVHDTVQPEHVTLWLPRNDSRTHGP